jgi:glutathione S-transferase
MIVYHFATSPFARRVRLVLAYKGCSAELRDPRANPELQPELQRLSPMHTVPVLVDEARVIVDSTAIVHYLERKIPEPPVFPKGVAGAFAFELAALADAAIGIISDVGARYYALHDHPRFPKARELMVGRAQRALDTMADRVLSRGNGVPLCGEQWSWADIVVYTTVAWLEGLPIRAATQAAPNQMVSLGWTLPAALSEWADQHRSRPDVMALD